ncbi:hypothetical protein E2C01_055262 [Portunus trituberculatus]|uniref:Uncharacterized protein n=1 Tax=Portunus trituberculatus TaxID=210409 RepID=A0A5B7GVG8_PORTR|nr:hypothetical protein [Portunus trituberculatus]
MTDTLRSSGAQSKQSFLYKYPATCLAPSRPATAATTTSHSLHAKHNKITKALSQTSTASQKYYDALLLFFFAPSTL